MQVFHVTSETRPAARFANLERILSRSQSRCWRTHRHLSPARWSDKVLRNGMKWELSIKSSGPERFPRNRTFESETLLHAASLACLHIVWMFLRWQSTTAVPSDSTAFQQHPATRFLQRSLASSTWSQATGPTRVCSIDRTKLEPGKSQRCWFTGKNYNPYEGCCKCRTTQLPPERSNKQRGISCF